MRTRSSFLVGVSLAVLISAAPAAAQEIPTAGGAALEEIVVTAQKREQSLQDVPVAVTALTQDVLTANRVQNVADLNAIAPNVTVRQTAGGAGIPAFSIRGALSIGVAPGGDREVGFYVDGVYIGHAQGSMFDLADVHRMEVLRGPQGTLFGRNATAGAINIVTQDPTGEFGLRQELTFGNYDQFRSKTRLELPAWGPFTAAITYAHTERRGDLRNLGAGRIWDFRNGGKGFRTSPKTLGDENNESVFAALRFEPSSDVEFIYRFDWSDFDGTPNGNGSAGFGPPLDGGLARLLYSNQPNPEVLTPITTRRPKAVNNAFTTPMTMRVLGHNLTARWRLSGAVTLKNVLAYRKARTFSSYDLGGLGGTVLLPGVFPGVPGGTPILIAGSFVRYDHKQVSDELQLNIETERVTATAGLLHYYQKQHNGGPDGLDNTFLLRPVPGFVLPTSAFCVNPAAPTTCGGAGQTKGTSQAAYLQVEGHLTPQLDIVGGFRVTKDKKSGGFLLNSFRVKDTNKNYLVGVNYRPIDSVLIYGKYSTAFMSGGGNIGSFAPDLRTYEPEYAYSWEAGVKADLFDRRLRANLAVFTVKYEDLQFITSGQACGDVSAGVCVYNAGDSRAKGFELEMTALPVDGVFLSAGVGYTDVEYANLSPRATATTGSFSPHLRPKWTANLAAQYDTQPVFGDAHVRLRLDANFRSKTLLAAEAAPAFQPQVTNDGIWILNGRVALTDIEVSGHKVEVGLWGRNLTNDKHMAWINSYFFMYPTSYERARTYGIDVRFDW